MVSIVYVFCAPFYSLLVIILLSYCETATSELLPALWVCALGLYSCSSFHFLSTFCEDSWSFGWSCLLITTVSNYEFVCFIKIVGGQALFFWMSLYILLQYVVWLFLTFIWIAQSWLICFSCVIIWFCAGDIVMILCLLSSCPSHLIISFYVWIVQPGFEIQEHDIELPHVNEAPLCNEDVDNHDNVSFQFCHFLSLCFLTLIFM